MATSDNQRSVNDAAAAAESTPTEHLEAIGLPSFAIDEAFNIAAVNSDAAQLLRKAGPLTGRNIVEVLRTVCERPFNADFERRFQQLSLMTDKI